MESIKKNMIKIDEVDLDRLPEEPGIFLVYREPGEKHEFNNQSVNNSINNSKKNYDAIILKDYFDQIYKDDKATILMVDFNINLKKGIKSFLMTGGLAVSDSENLKYESKGKIIWQMQNYLNLSIGYITIEDPKKIKTQLINWFKNKYNGIPIANHKFVDNDAIASWSGYNFQGASMLLNVLKRMNSICEIEYKLFAVELEKYEDYVIYRNNTPIELYQVKARLNDIKQNAYSDAITKLLLHKKQLTSKHNLSDTKIKCFLVSAVEIDDWCHSEIELYQHQSKYHQPLKKIVKYIKDEIQIFYSNKEIKYDKVLIENSYSFLCQEIDKLIYQNHYNRSKKKELDYKINMSTFNEILMTSNKKMIVSLIARNQERVQKEIFSSIEKKFENYCNRCTNKICQVCSIPNFVSALNTIDVLKYGIILSPMEEHTEDDYRVAAAFSVNNLNTVFKQFRMSQADWFEYDSNHIFIKKDNSERNIIPTALNFEDDSDESLSIQEFFKLFSTNPNLNLIIKNSALTSKMENKSIFFDNSNITKSPENEYTSKSKSSIKQQLNLELINQTEFKHRME